MKQSFKPSNFYLFGSWVAYFFERGNAILNALVFLYLFNKDNSPGSSSDSIFQKSQYQGLHSNLTFSIFWTLSLDTSKPNLEP
jgi:hypothetical protein